MSNYTTNCTTCEFLHLVENDNIDKNFIFLFWLFILFTLNQGDIISVFYIGFFRKSLNRVTPQGFRMSPEMSCLAVWEALSGGMILGSSPL